MKICHKTIFLDSEKNNCFVHIYLISLISNLEEIICNVNLNVFFVKLFERNHIVHNKIL